MYRRSIVIFLINSGAAPAAYKMQQALTRKEMARELCNCCRRCYTITEVASRRIVFSAGMFVICWMFLSSRRTNTDGQVRDGAFLSSVWYQTEITCHNVKSCFDRIQLDAMDGARISFGLVDLAMLLPSIPNNGAFDGRSSGDYFLVANLFSPCIK